MSATVVSCRRLESGLPLHDTLQGSPVVNRFWFFFFSIAGVAAVVSFAVAPSMGWWFPAPGPSLSPLGAQIDDLFYLILVITGVTFIGVMIALGYILWKYGSGRGQRSVFTHGSHTLEVVWSIIPA